MRLGYYYTEERKETDDHYPGHVSIKAYALLYYSLKELCGFEPLPHEGGRASLISLANPPCCG
jgi:hypothetical protein